MRQRFLSPFITCFSLAPMTHHWWIISAEPSVSATNDPSEVGFGYFPLVLAVILVAVGLIVRYRHRASSVKDDHNATNHLE